MLPIHQSEAMWLNFDCGYPMALKVGTGKVCAVSGDDWSSGLISNPQNYCVLPDQPWLDGYCVEKGVIRQFVAAPLGKGVTVEEQLTGKGEWGGKAKTGCHGNGGKAFLKSSSHYILLKIQNIPVY